MAHHREAMIRWGEEHRRLSLYDSYGRHVSSVAIPCPERIPPEYQHHRELRKADFLDNVIIDTMTTAVLPSLYNLRHRIDRQTTICLLHPGLGLVEDLNQKIFTDPLRRPMFFLTHSTHQFVKVSGRLYSMRQRKQGALYLHGVPTFEDLGRSQSRIAMAGLRQSQHFVGLLSSAETLNAVSLPWARFLSWKLPAVIFSSLADTISVILGCKYGDMIPNQHAQTMWDHLLDETLTIVSQFPELQEVPHRRDYFIQDSFRQKLRGYLFAQRFNVSPWVKLVRMGGTPPVEYFNGYFVRRAEELGLDCKHNRMAERTVNARMNARRREIRIDLVGTSPYMTDSDTIAGGQSAPSLEDILELDLEPI
ncbi:hypothetical protein F5Y10DRAFT_250863 [Nemania abortiva]|nr:hypothetical protein F5Y10DRAFT_250863 [Nemania abortiva]